MALLVLLLVVVPVAEFSALVWVAHLIGVLPMLALLFAVSILGAALAKRVGIEVWRRFRATLAAGDIPSGEVLDGALVLIAATIAKVFLYDLSSLSGPLRVLSFIALGALLMGVSFIYQRDWLKLSGKGTE